MTTLTHACKQASPERLTNTYLAAAKSAVSANLAVFRPENILVTAKSLQSSQTAFGCARWFADQAGSKISVLFLTDVGSSPKTQREVQEEITRTTGMKSDNFKAILSCTKMAGVQQIANAAQAEGADLIIIPANFFCEAHHDYFYVAPMADLIQNAFCPIVIVGDKRFHTAPYFTGRTNFASCEN